MEEETGIKIKGSGVIGFSTIKIGMYMGMRSMCKGMRGMYMGMRGMCMGMRVCIWVCGMWGMCIVRNSIFNPILF